MLKVIMFILETVTHFMKMLFTIQVDDNLSLGLLMCIVFIFLPIVHRIICFIKQDAMEELDDMYDSSRPHESWIFSENQHYNPSTGRASRTYNSSHRQWRSRRYR